MEGKWREEGGERRRENTKREESEEGKGRKHDSKQETGSGIAFKKREVVYRRLEREKRENMALRVKCELCSEANADLYDVGQKMTTCSICISRYEHATTGSIESTFKLKLILVCTRPFRHLSFVSLENVLT